MSSFESKKEEKEIEVECPECKHQFSIEVTAEADVEIPDVYINLNIKK